MGDWRGAISEFLQRFSAFRTSAPIDSVTAFEAFLGDHAAFVAQKKLYEYVKQRMGMSYPQHFANDTFIASLNVAKWRVFAACLSDLALWMAAELHARRATGEEAKALARFAHDRVVAERFSAAEMRGDPGELCQAFATRAALADLAPLADSEIAFRLSPKELVRWAPIAEELKLLDHEIVINSLRFAWLAVRDDFRRMLDAEAVTGDWRRKMVNSKW